MTQLVEWTGDIQTPDAKLSVDTWWGIRDRSWGLRPHPSADKSASSNLMRNQIFGSDPLRGVLNKILKGPKCPQFYWFWCQFHFVKGGIAYHSQENRHGQVDNGDAHFFGDPLGLGKTLKVVSAGRSGEYKRGTRHLQSLKIVLLMEDGSRVVASVSRKQMLFPFVMSGVGYGHPVWGHGNAHGKCEVTLQQDAFMTEMIDRNKPLNWHIQELSEVTLEYFENQSTNVCTATCDGVGAVEQLALGPHAPSGFESIYDV
jgi:hypothetical protein